MCGASELVGLSVFELFRVMIQVGSVSRKTLSDCDEAMCSGSKFQRVKVLGKKLYFNVLVLQLYGMYHKVCERVVGCDHGVRYLNAGMATRLFVILYSIVRPDMALLCSSICQWR